MKTPDNPETESIPEWLKQIYADTDKRIEESLAKSREESEKEMKKLRQLIGGVANSNCDMTEEAIYNVLLYLNSCPFRCNAPKVL